MFAYSTLYYLLLVSWTFEPEINGMLFSLNRFGNKRTNDLYSGQLYFYDILKIGLRIDFSDLHYDCPT